MADAFKSRLPDFHGWKTIMQTPRQDVPEAAAATVKDGDKQDSSDAAAAWEARVIEDWSHDRLKIADHYDFDPAQDVQAGAIFTYHEGRLKDYLKTNRDNIAAFRHELFLIEQRSAANSADNVPFEKSRLAKKKAAAAAAGTEIQAGVKAFEEDLHRELLDLATTKAKSAAGEVRLGDASLETFDKLLIYSQFAIGGCLLVGLFTRLAALGAGTFLVFVLLTQPPWVVGYSTPLGSGNQVVMMLASLVLVGTAAGRWAGLDFFVHAMLGNCCKGGKGDA
ncbi:MAG: DoxX family protein [Pirellulales bacterium]